MYLAMNLFQGKFYAINERSGKNYIMVKRPQQLVPDGVTSVHQQVLGSAARSTERSHYTTETGTMGLKDLQA